MIQLQSERSIDQATNQENVMQLLTIFLSDRFNLNGCELENSELMLVVQHMHDILDSCIDS